MWPSNISHPQDNFKETEGYVFPLVSTEVQLGVVSVAIIGDGGLENMAKALSNYSLSTKEPSFNGARLSIFNAIYNAKQICSKDFKIQLNLCGELLF